MAIYSDTLFLVFLRWYDLDRFKGAGFLESAFSRPTPQSRPSRDFLHDG